MWCMSPMELICNLQVPTERKEKLICPSTVRIMFAWERRREIEICLANTDCPHLHKMLDDLGDRLNLWIPACVRVLYWAQSGCKKLGGTVAAKCTFKEGRGQTGENVDTCKSWPCACLLHARDTATGRALHLAFMLPFVGVDLIVTPTSHWNFSTIVIYLYKKNTLKIHNHQAHYMWYYWSISDHKSDLNHVSNLALAFPFIIIYYIFPLWNNPKKVWNKKM